MHKHNTPLWLWTGRCASSARVNLEESKNGDACQERRSGGGGGGARVMQAMPTWSYRADHGSQLMHSVAVPLVSMTGSRRSLVRAVPDCAGS